VSGCTCARCQNSFLKSQNEGVQIVGLQPSEGASIAGIRRWPKVRGATHLHRLCCNSKSAHDDRRVLLTRVSSSLCAGVSAVHLR
jgi:hypothetical protein